MRPETIFFISAAAACVAIASRAAKIDRPAALLCSIALLVNTVISNAGWYSGILTAGRDGAAFSMIAIIAALFIYHRPWTVPVACIAVTSLVIRGIFEQMEMTGEDMRWYKIAATNTCFVLQLLIVAMASLSGGKRGEQFHVGVNRSRTDRDLGGGKAGPKG